MGKPKTSGYDNEMKELQEQQLELQKQQMAALEKRNETMDKQHNVERGNEYIERADAKADKNMRIGLMELAEQQAENERRDIQEMVKGKLSTPNQMLRGFNDSSGSKSGSNTEGLIK